MRGFKVRNMVLLCLPVPSGNRGKKFERFTDSPHKTCIRVSASQPLVIEIEANRRSCCLKSS